MRSHSFWSAPVNSLGSWIWQKLLSLRGQVSAFLKVAIGDGKEASFWYDNWLPGGPLIDITGEMGPNYLGVSLNTTVADATNATGWKIRGQRGRQYRSIFSSILSTPLPNAERGPDQFLWRQNSSTFTPGFSATNTWDQIRVHRPHVPWYTTIWFPQAIPRCSFISWLAIHDRLPTGNRMRAWGQSQPCPLCGERDETRDHLFFACPYTYTVWLTISGRMLGSRANPDWCITLASVSKGLKKKHHSLLLRLAFQITLYNVWRERNQRIHIRTYTTTMALAQGIDKMARNRISSLMYYNDPKYHDLLQIWFSITNIS